MFLDQKILASKDKQIRVRKKLGKKKYLVKKMWSKTISGPRNFEYENFGMFMTPSLRHRFIIMYKKVGIYHS